jgi:hypothetical protein
MGILNRLRDALIQPSIDDAHLYAHIAKEIESGLMREGLWAKALSESEFDEGKARAVYMRMAVKSLQQELRARANEEASRQNSEMENAIALYDKGQYFAALNGLVLRVQKKGDALAMVCLANIAWHGLANGEIDRQSASELIAAAEKSTDANARRYLGVVLEPIDWRRSLANYDWASSNGHKEAGTRAREFRKRLVSQGLLPRGVLSKLFG